jgi:hypothetical protein
MGPHKVNGCGMTPELARALNAYRLANGKRWKGRLRLLWLRGHDEGELRQIRNVVGPGGRRLEKIEQTLLETLP